MDAANARSYAQQSGGTLAVRFPMRPGTRMTLKPASGKPQTLEYYAGSGYLSQSPPVLFFASPREEAARTSLLGGSIPGLLELHADGSVVATM